MTSRFYVPTCSLAADAFFALGAPLRVNCTPDRDMALERARQIATQHGGDPVVLAFDTPFSALAGLDVFLPMRVDPEEAAVDCIEFRDSPRARLGIAETAFIGALVDGLTEVVKFADNVTKFGQGDGRVDVDDLVPQKVKDKYADWRNEQERKKEDQKAKKSGAKPGSNAHNQRQKLLRPGVKSAKAPKAAKQATKGKPAKKATPATPAVPAMQGKRPSKGTPPKPAKGEKVAHTTVQLDGQIDGKPAKAVIKKGTKYRIVQGPGGKTLHRKGQKPFVVSPGHAGKV